MENVNFFSSKVTNMIEARVNPDGGYDDTMIPAGTLLEELGQYDAAAASIAWDSVFLDSDE